MKKNDIGILTWHYYYNFGSALQTYASESVISRIGNCEIINYRNPELYSISPLSEFAHYIISVTVGKIINRFYYPYMEFQRKHFNQTKLLKSKSEVVEYTKKYRTIVCGSDQIWAPSVLNDIYLLDGVDSHKVNKVSYAASFGINSIPDDLKGVYKKALSDYSHISVREEKGKELLSNIFNINSTVVLDPTLLLDSKTYEKLIKPCKIKKGYVFCYFLSENDSYYDRLKQYEEDKVLVGYAASKGKFDVTLNNIGPGEFLWLIKNADTIITDSYHGMIFSLIFHKDFYVYERFSSKDVNNQNSRIETLMALLSLYDRIVPFDAMSIQTASDINYRNVDIILEENRKKSLLFLREAIK